MANPESPFSSAAERQRVARSRACLKFPLTKLNQKRPTMELQQSFRDKFAERYPAAGTQGRVDRVLVQRMNKTEAKCQSTFRILVLPDEPHKAALPLQFLQTLFDIGRIGVERFGHHGCLKVIALDAGCSQQLSVVFPELLHFPTHHAADRFRQLRQQFGKGIRQGPAIVLHPDRVSFPQIPQQIRRKKRIALGTLVNCLRKFLRESIPGKLASNVFPNLLVRKKSQLNFAADPSRFEIQFESEEWVVARVQFRCSVADQEEGMDAIQLRT